MLCLCGLRLYCLSTELPSSIQDATGTVVFSAGSRNAILGDGQEGIPSVKSTSVKQVA